jgi:pentapeptide MXKDX repeat protein
LRERFGRNKTADDFSRETVPMPSDAWKARNPEKKQAAGNKSDCKIVGKKATSSRFQNRFSKGRHTMTISTRIVLGISAAAISLSLALAPAAFAQDKMGKDDGMKKETMSKSKSKKKSSKKDDGMTDGMKKDDGMKK